MDISQRIFELAEKKYSQKEFAEVLGVKPQRISEWKRGLSNSYQKYLPQIAEALGTTTEYLLTGEGPKKKTAPAVSDSDTRPDWLIKFEKLSPVAQREVIAFIDFKQSQE